MSNTNRRRASTGRLYQFYFYVDTLVTWIPELRVWDWDGDILHERTVYLRIVQFYDYFNQPSLEQRNDLNDNDSIANAIIPKRLLDAQDATGYQFVQCRGLIVIDSPIGKVACLPMGMAPPVAVLGGRGALSEYE